MAVDWTDPCAKAAALSTAYYALVSGQGESYIRYRGPEGEREVRYQKADLSVLKAEMLQAQADCDAKNGVASKSRRFAIRGGSLRRC